MSVVGVLSFLLSLFATPSSAAAPAPPPEIVTPAPAPEPQYETFTITTYTNDYASTGKSRSNPMNGITASGVRVEEGDTVSCSREYPFGTKFYVKQLDHTFTCTDRGGAVKGKHLDIYVTDGRRAQEFGTQKLDVTLIQN